MNGSTATDYRILWCAIIALGLLVWLLGAVVETQRQRMDRVEKRMGEYLQDPLGEIDWDNLDERKD